LGPFNDTSAKQPQSQVRSQGLSIKHAGTEKAIFLYNGKPMFMTGPVPEFEPFAYEWGSTSFKHDQWFKWMKSYGLSYGRIYPESGTFDGNTSGDKRIFPFHVHHWEAGRPIFDLQKLDDRYFKNMARVIKACAKRDIVLHLQLYQRCYFAGYVWKYSFFNPLNNVNDLGLGKYRRRGQISGYDYWQKSLDDPELWKIHAQYTRRILDAIGDNNNILFDLMNEPGEWEKKKQLTGFGVPKEWVTKTLDLIEEWEKARGIHLIKGMYIQFKECEFSNFVHKHPRIDYLITHGEEIFGRYANVDCPKLRKALKKPMISAHNGGRIPPEQKIYLYGQDHPRKRACQWLCLMQKVQGLGVYAKRAVHTDLKNPNVQTYADQSKILMDFFKTIIDYEALRDAREKIVQAPGIFKFALTSNKETIVYLHTKEYEKTVPAGQKLFLAGLKIPDGKVNVLILHPENGKKSNQTQNIKGGQLSLELPQFYEDILVYINQ
jgi:hypothetical protein